MTSSTERGSVAIVDSVLERELGFHRERLSVQLRVRIDEVVERIALLRWVESDVLSSSRQSGLALLGFCDSTQTLPAEPAVSGLFK